MKYWVSVCLVMEGGIEADTPEEAFELMSDYAISGGDWTYSYKKLDEAESEENYRPAGWRKKWQR